MTTADCEAWFREVKRWVQKGLAGEPPQPLHDAVLTTLPSPGSSRTQDSQDSLTGLSDEPEQRRPLQLVPETRLSIDSETFEPPASQWHPSLTREHLRRPQQLPARRRD